MAFRLLFWVLLVVAAAEVSAHNWIIGHVPETGMNGNYHQAATLIRRQFDAEDAVSVAPDWIGPMVREQLGDQMTLAMVARPDLSEYRRLWTVTIRGHRANDRPKSTPEFEQTFGNVTVRRYALPAPLMKINLVKELASAQVFDLLGPGGRQQRPCRYVRTHPAGGRGGGGLGHGTVPPPERFVCRGGRDGMVAAVVTEDLNLQPRYCVWQPAARGRASLVRFTNVVLSDHLVIDAGMYYEHERDGADAPVDLRVRINGEIAGTLHHEDGQGFVRLSIPTEDGTSATVEFEARSQRRRRPGFCWSASTRVAGEVHP